MDTETKKYLDRIYAEIKKQAQQSSKVTWVKPSWITKLTGWKAEELRQAREEKLIDFKANDSGGWLYRLESVPKEFIKQTVG